MQSVPWDAFDQPIAGNSLCIIHYSVWNEQTFFITYIPQIVLEHPHAIYILKEFFGLPSIDLMAC